MYSKNNNITIGVGDLSNYIQGFDIYNSRLLAYLQNPLLEKIAYEITVYRYRPDLIAKDVYGSEEYQGLLMIQAGLTLDNLEKGVVLSLIPKDVLDNIIKSL